AAVAPVRPAPGHVGLAAEAHAAVAAGTRLDVDPDAVIQHVRSVAGPEGSASNRKPGFPLAEIRPTCIACRNAAYFSPAGLTEIGRPLRPVLNSTVPGRVAKIVSSRPIPVPGPGLKRVPRWRTMISPPVTVWPAKTLTPSRFALESRPLRLEPNPFLCAIY